MDTISFVCLSVALYATRPRGMLKINILCHLEMEVFYKNVSSPRGAVWTTFLRIYEARSLDIGKRILDIKVHL